MAPAVTDPQGAAVVEGPLRSRRSRRKAPTRPRGPRRIRSSHRYQRWRAAGILRNEPLCRACAEVGYPVAADHRSITVSDAQLGLQPPGVGDARQHEAGGRLLPFLDPGPPAARR